MRAHTLDIHCIMLLFVGYKAPGGFSSNGSYILWNITAFICHDLHQYSIIRLVKRVNAFLYHRCKLMFKVSLVRIQNLTQACKPSLHDLHTSELPFIKNSSSFSINNNNYYFINFIYSALNFSLHYLLELLQITNPAFIMSLQ